MPDHMPVAAWDAAPAIPRYVRGFRPCTLFLRTWKENHAQAFFPKQIQRVALGAAGPVLHCILPAVKLFFVNNQLRALAECRKAMADMGLFRVRQALGDSETTRARL